MQFFLRPEQDHLPDFITGLAEIKLTRSGGQTQSINPQQTKLRLVDEHPQVDRMDGDWGAICEVYKRKSDLFLTLTGVRLESGDVITFLYGGTSRVVTMRVMEMEGDRARVEVLGNE